MSLNRDELAARFAVAAWGGLHTTKTSVAYDEVATRAVTMADALLAALAPKHDDATPPAPYVPKVGDIVRVTREASSDECMCFMDPEWARRGYLSPCATGRVVESPDSTKDSHGFVAVVRADGARPGGIHRVEASRVAPAPPPAPAPTVAPLTEEERVDLADAMRRARAGHASVYPWDRLDTYDKKAALDRADAAAEWFAKRGGAK